MECYIDMIGRDQVLATQVPHYQFDELMMDALEEDLNYPAYCVPVNRMRLSKY